MSAQADSRPSRAPIVFGAADGLTSILGIIAGMVASGQPHLAVWSAALSGSVAAFFGMANGQYQSAPERGVWAALACGAATCVAGLLPAFPFLLGSGWAEVALSVATVCALAGVIAIWRPERGWRAVAQTYGLLAVAAGGCALAGAAIPA